MALPPHEFPKNKALPPRDEKESSSDSKESDEKASRAYNAKFSGTDG